MEISREGQEAARRIEEALNRMPSFRANELAVHTQFLKDQAVGELTIVRLWEEPLPGCGGYFDAVLDAIEWDTAYLVGSGGEEKQCHVNEVELVDPPSPIVHVS